MVDVWIVASNVALVLVTAATIWVTLREEHRHTEEEQVIALVHEAIHAEEKCPQCARQGGRHEDHVQAAEQVERLEQQVEQKVEQQPSSVTTLPHRAAAD